MCMILRLTGYNEHDGVCAVGQLDDEGQRPSLQSLNIAARITFCGPDNPPPCPFLFSGLMKLISSKCIMSTNFIVWHFLHMQNCSPMDVGNLNEK